MTPPLTCNTLPPPPSVSRALSRVKGLITESEPPMRILDLFCGAGGAAMGYAKAGFDVVGVDIHPRRRYPFQFIQADALDILTDRTFLAQFDAIHASPPCQSESTLRHRTGVDYTDLLTPTLRALQDVDLPWIVENVASTDKMPGSLVLCGTEFGLKVVCRDGRTRWLKRHRRFLASFPVMGAGGCNCAGRLIGGVYGTGGGGPQTRGYRFHPEEARQAMGIDWMTREELSQAIPPAYTEFLGEQLADHIAGALAA